MDMNQYLDLFLEEAGEHVQTLNQNLLSLENNPERLDLLDEIFRAAHTLKGMSATMGFDQVSHLTHEMENLLDKLRQRRVHLNQNIINCLFDSVDALEKIIEFIRNGQEDDADTKELTLKIKEISDGKYVFENEHEREEKNNDFDSSDESVNIIFNEYEKNIIDAAAQKGIKAWQIGVSIDESCLMKGVRAFMVFKNLENIGEIIKSVPIVQDIEDEKFGHTFTVVLLTSLRKKDIIKSIETISEVKIQCINRVKENKNTKDTDEKVVNNKKTEVIQQENNNERKAKIHQTVRVDIGRLDNLMSLVGELVINKTRLERIKDTQDLDGLNETIEQINRITTDLQTVVQNVRMVSIEQVFNRFPRMVRDLAKELDKEVNLILEGKETELDRTVIDEIGDPLVHLIRNAIDHGLESREGRISAQKDIEGVLRLSARHEGNQVIIAVEDDGNGIDIDAVRNKAIKNGVLNRAQLDTMDDQAILNLIFEPGFSTAKNITDISGRGVGLDVVKSKIQALNGHVSVETKKGKGTKFIIKMPLTLAIIQALMVSIQKEIYAIPLGNIDETTNLDRNNVKDIHGQQVMLLRGKVLPLIFLKDLLSVPGDVKQDEVFVVVVRRGEQQVGLVVEELKGQQEIVINSIGKLLSGITGIAGASILGDGTVSLILDIGTLF